MNFEDHTQTLAADDEAILQAQRDPVAFGTLYEKYFKKIYLFVLHRVEERELAADLTQEVFIKALKNIHKFELRGLPFSSWLFRIAINECNESYRRNKKMRIVTLEDESIKNLSTELMVENKLEEMAQLIPGVLQKLKDIEVSIIELRFFEGRSFREIGEILNMTELNAKVKTYRTLDKMKGILTP